MSKGERNRRLREEENQRRRQGQEGRTFSMRDLENEVSKSVMENKASEVLLSEITGEAARVMWRYQTDPVQLAREYQEAREPGRERPYMVIPYPDATLFADWISERGRLEIWRWGERGEKGPEPVKGGRFGWDLN